MRPVVLSILLVTLSTPVFTLDCYHTHVFENFTIIHEKEAVKCVPGVVFCLKKILDIYDDQPKRVAYGCDNESICSKTECRNHDKGQLCCCDTDMCNTGSSTIGLTTILLFISYLIYRFS